MTKGRKTSPEQDAPEPREAVLAGLRSYSAISAEISKRFAGSLGLHPTDATALIEILEAEERGMHLSPARLSERIGLTSGATSSLLNRLEEAGHVVRSRIHSDRRVVTLQSTAGVQEVAKAFFDPLAVRLDATMSSYPTSLLEELDTLLAELHAVTEEYVQDLPS